MAKKTNSAGMIARFIPLLFFVVMIWFLISTVSLVVKVLYSYLAIPLLLIALFLNYSVVTDYFSGLMREIKEDTGKGLIKTAASIAGYPFVFAYLALKAWTKRALGSKRPSVKDQKSKGKDDSKGDYIKYEEVEEDDFLELEDIDKKKVKVKQTQSKTNDNDYDDLFA